MDKLTQGNTYASLNGAEEVVSSMFGGSFKMIGLALVAIVILVLVYFIYQKMNGEGEEDVEPTDTKPKKQIPEPNQEVKKPEKDLISMSSSESEEHVDDSNEVW